MIVLPDVEPLTPLAEHVTKRYGQQIETAYSTFLTHIQGIASESERRQYATLMLNRLIAVYFLQTKGALDGDPCYLSNRLRLVREQQGKDRFYRHFLLSLFHERLGKDGDTTEVEEFGNVSSLNLDLFSKHAVERNNANIQIADATFSQLFTFLDGYRWQLDESATPGENELRPGILAAIFEQQIDRKQMGAYYTGSDVTAYIARNTIIPYLFDAVKRKNPAAFTPGSAFWRRLQAHPDRYIYQTIRRTEYLPTETEREYQTRRLRYERLCSLLRTGTICNIQDLITHNLNILQFALDTITTCEQPGLLLSFYDSLEQMAILDPTCGTGAFLLAALGILKLLYTACLDRMTAIGNTTCASILKRVAQHGKCDHFIITSILSNNLHGVDVMEEAIDICKTRLFLALVAHSKCADDIKELPALAGNIKIGNAVVGFIRVNVGAIFALGNQQRMQDHPQLGKAQVEQDQVVEVDGYKKDNKGKTDHRPFHWSIEFGHIIGCGGFDVIIGNPPYVEYSKIRQDYMVYGYEKESCGNLYAAVIERSLALCHEGQSYLGLLVPLSVCGGERFEQLRRTISESSSARWLSNFEIFPCRLFDGAFQRLSILLARHGTSAEHATFVTRIQRWYASERPYLIDLISYTPARSMVKPGVFPRLASPLQESILQKARERAGRDCIATVLQPQRTDYFVYYQEATNYWTKAVCCVPFYRKNGRIMNPPHGRFLYFADERTARIIMALMNSSLFYVWFATYADGFHLAHGLVKDFPTGKDLYTMQALPLLSQRLESDIRQHAQMSTRNTKPDASKRKEGLLIELEEYHMGYSKSLIDEIDARLAEYYGFTSDELDFIINYDIKYRMGKGCGPMGAL